MPLDNQIPTDNYGNIDWHHNSLGDALNHDKNKPAYQQFVDTGKLNISTALYDGESSNQGATLTVPGSQHKIKIIKNSEKINIKHKANSKAKKNDDKIFDDIKRIKNAINDGVKEEIRTGLLEKIMGYFALSWYNMTPVKINTLSNNNLSQNQINQLIEPNELQSQSQIDSSKISLEELERYIIKINHFFNKQKISDSQYLQDDEKVDHLKEMSKELKKQERDMLKQEWRESKEGKLWKAKANNFKNQYLTMNIYFGNKTREAKNKDPYIQISLEEKGIHTCIQVTPGEIKAFRKYYDRVELLFYADKGEVKYSIGKFSLTSGIDYRGNFIKSIRWAINRIIFSIGDRKGDSYGEILYTSKLNISGYFEKLFKYLR